MLRKYKARAGEMGQLVKGLFLKHKNLRLDL